MPQSNQVREAQLLSPCSSAHELRLLNPECHAAHALLQEIPEHYSEDPVQPKLKIKLLRSPGREVAIMIG